MKNGMKKKLAMLSAILLCLSLFGCGESEESSESETVAATLGTFTYSDEDKTVVNGKSIYFAQRDDLLELRPQLVKLLSNESKPYYDLEDKSIAGYTPPDPNSPSIPYCYQCALFDVNLDGVPELIVYPFGYGGSAGNATYFAYDIMTGKQIGYFGSSSAGDWCTYFDLRDGTLKQMAIYTLRSGWAQTTRYVDGLKYNELDDIYYNDEYFCDMHEVDHVRDEEENCWREVPIEDHYSIDGRMVLMEEYYCAYDSFFENCIRLPETEMQLIPWNEISEDDDDNLMRAEKMADALLTSSQRVVLPQK